MANLKASNKFTRGLRLLKAKEFNQVFSAPLAKQTCAGFLVLVKPNLATHARLGFVFGKKNIKLAVTRNRFKRIFREHFRHNYQQLGSYDLVVLALKNAATTSEKNLKHQLPIAWQKLVKQLNKLN